MKLKKSLSLLLVLMMALSCISLPALADAPWADGATPKNTQIFYTATAKVEPNVDSSSAYRMTNYDANNSTFDSGTGKGIMAFTADITTISEYAFQENGNLISIVLPESVTEIANHAFDTCSNLESIAMPKATTIGDMVFEECSALQYIYAPKDVADSLNEYSLYSVTLSSVTNGTLALTEANFDEVSDCTIYAKSETTVQCTATPNKDYRLDTLTATYNDGEVKNLDVTDNSFIMPYYAVTVNATFSETTGDIDLDLESSTADIPDKTTIDQYYQKTTGEETVTNYKVQVTWTAQTLQINVADAYVWDAVNLTWKTDSANNGTATLVENSNVRTYTFINYSPEALTCSVTFAAAEGLADKYTSFSAESATLGTVEKDSDGNALSKYFNEDGSINIETLPSASITCTITPNLDGFQNATAVTEATYGTYTINVNKN